MAAINLSGFNGIDFNSIMTAVMQQERQPLEELQRQQNLLQQKDSALNSLANLIGAIQTPITSLTSASSFTNVAANSSDTTVATVSLGDGGIPGDYQVVVGQLAKSQTTSSTNGFAAATTVVADGGSISFTINGSTTTEISISANTTLSALKEAINNQASGVAASIVNDGTNYKLLISSRETGSTNGFTINNSLTNSGGSTVAFAAGQSASSGNVQNAQNAAFTVNGLAITSASNAATEAIPGVTVTLRDAGSALIDVSSDYTTLKDNVKKLATEYNKLRQFYNTQNAARGPLATDSVLRGALNDIKSVLLASNSNGGRYRYLSEVGVEFLSTGDIKIDETKLNAAIDGYPADLQKLFQGAGAIDGTLEDLKETLANLDGTAGLIKSTRSSIDTSIKNYRDRITSQEMRLEIKRQELIKLYTAADQAMQRLSAASGSLTNLQNRTF
jgi:flagellar hook-associated protein 2